MITIVRRRPSRKSTKPVLFMHVGTRLENDVDATPPSRRPSAARDQRFQPIRRDPRVVIEQHDVLPAG